MALKMEEPGAQAKGRVPGNQDKPPGKYLYCVVEDACVNFAFTGMNDGRITAVRHEGLSAVVQDGVQGLYGKDGGVLRNLAIAHHKVVDAAAKMCGASLPFSFGNVVTGAGRDTPEERISAWLGRNYGVLKGKLEKVRGKAEYGVQVLWDTEVMAAKLIEKSPELKRLDQAARASSPGTAFMYREKLRMALRQETEAMADERFRTFYGRIKKTVDEIKVDGIKKADGVERMLLNFSCLARDHEAEELGKILDDIEREGFAVVFTGPWPPYSFV
ncbi:MAG: GvpL/GvpF family gas vesicle protein [Deltaproteobacteria bacterium]|nr:GvpL/GvpF family gas vesicle protein [Deltaproteobacteria bacterium]